VRARPPREATGLADRWQVDERLEMAITTRNGVEGKVCSDCRTRKPLTEFYATERTATARVVVIAAARICYRLPAGKAGVLIAAIPRT
jgi:hypothetical protein